jgi:hypothetical protein
MPTPRLFRLRATGLWRLCGSKKSGNATGRPQRSGPGPAGLLYLRRTDPAGAIRVLGHRWEVDPLWVHRLVRAEVDLVANQIRCYRLRRRAPEEQPLFKTFPYVFPTKPFHPT